MMKQALTFLHIFVIHVRQSFYHKSAVLAMILVWMVRVGMTIILYTVIYDRIGGRSIRGVTYETVLSSVLLGMIFAGFGTREITRLLNTEYKAGSFGIWVNKPLPYIILKAIEALGKAVPTGFGLLACALAYWVLSHHVPQADHYALRVMFGVILMLVGWVLSACIYTMIGLSAVFFHDARPVHLIVDKLLMLYGGTYVPVIFFPHWFRLTGELSPIASTTFITQTFYPDFLDNVPRFIVTQIIWLILAALALRKMMRMCNDRLTTNGG